MSQRNPLESDERFPSGEWSGYFLQPDSGEQKHWMSFRLEFAAGVLRGEGTDWVGPFTLAGEYDLATGKCAWIKHYLGRHDVHYQGFNRGEGIIGHWQIAGVSSDRFHLWPKGFGSLEEHYLHAEQTMHAW